MNGITCDLFCTVVDNYGDIGVCWRLAKNLSAEGVAVRLWVDDLVSFGKLCPELEVTLERQQCKGVEVVCWIPHPTCRPPSPASGRGAGGEGLGSERPYAKVTPAQLVIEAFACELPPDYIAAMAMLAEPPLWINLEYLSAEDWVEGCHGLPSPHPTLPLTKHFFFPGFTPKTGGLLLERDLLARRDAFQRDPQAIVDYWQSLDLPAPQPDELRISLFGYENAAVGELLQVWSVGATLVTCLVPEGRILPQVAQFFETTPFDALRVSGRFVGRHWRRGNLRVAVLPFVEQERYDYLLWACDVNFVRGEDSCVRAQWAAKPFVWQIYPQHDGVHLEKLQALAARYCAGLSPEAAEALTQLWQAWNVEQGAALAWGRFAAQREGLTQHAMRWSGQLAGNNLALNLLDFCRKAGRMRAFEFSPLNPFQGQMK
ncbi:MAG: elongation factor P maturation arginine rhamnosyltransferase EarP [Nitrosomonadales bacterium]|nr:elongation factor P maturation arginine rhamnosyltransferase EarP [Nitrosomonadales bacterium]